MSGYLCWDSTPPERFVSFIKRDDLSAEQHVPPVDYDSVQVAGMLGIVDSAFMSLSNVSDRRSRLDNTKCVLLQRSGLGVLNEPAAIGFNVETVQVRWQS